MSTSWYRSKIGVPDRKGALFGIELEYEGSKLPHLNDRMLSYWIAESDGSLRNGVELISREPMTYQQVQDASAPLAVWMHESNLNLTPRCSTHIHVNVSDMTVQQLKTMVWLSITMEPVILQFCSKLRQHNGFCLPSHKTVNITQDWRKLFNFLDGKGSYPRLSKYAAVGGFRLHDLGTLEFRMFPACQDTSRLLWYVDIVNSIRETAMSHTIEELLDRKIGQGLLSIITNVILDNRRDVTLSTLEECLEVGIRSANDILREDMSLSQIKSWYRELFPNQEPNKPAMSDSNFMDILTGQEPVSNLTNYETSSVRRVVGDGSNTGAWVSMFLANPVDGVDTSTVIDSAIELSSFIQRNPELFNDNEEEIF